MPSSLNISLCCLKTLRRFLHASALVSVCFLVSLPLAGFCSEEIDVTSVTNVVFNNYEDYELFRTNQINQADALYQDAHALEQQADHVYSQVQDAGFDVRYYATYAEIDEDFRDDLEDAVRLLNSAEEDASNLQYDLWNYKRSLETIKSNLEAASPPPTYMIMVTSTNVYDSGSSGEQPGGGCACPDYTSILSTIRERVGGIESKLGDLYDLVEGQYNLFTGFFDSFLYSASGNDNWDDEYSLAVQVGNYVGPIVSNVWASASPQTLQSRIGRYSAYIAFDTPSNFEPSPQEIASDVPLVAIVGLLYRIQHLMGSSSNVADVVTSWRDEEQDKEDQAKHDEEVAEGNMEDAISDAQDARPNFSFRANFEFLTAFSALSTQLERLHDALYTMSEADYLIVFDNDGMTVNLRGSGASSSVTRSGVIGIPSIRNRGTQNLWQSLSSLSMCVWYILAALLGLYLTYWCVRVFVHGVSLAFAAASGNLGASSVLAAKLASVMTGD